MTNQIRRNFGQGPAVSLFTLGTMRSIDNSKQMRNVVKSACQAGINHIETSPVYGKAEEYLGSAISNLARNGIQPQNGWVITSKILPGISFENGKHQLKAILKRLGLQKIDNLAIHGLNLFDHLEWSLNGDGRLLIDWAKKENLIGQIGFSSHGELSLIKQAINSKGFTFCSLHLHLFDPARIPLAKLAIKKGMGVMAISPADKGGRLQNPSQTLVEDCKPISPLELAYRFLLGNGISTLTIGARCTDDLELPRKLSRADGPLNIQEKKIIDHIQKIQRARLGDTFCGQCRKCLPCPSNIPITEILRLRNLSLAHEMKAYAKERYNLINRAGHWWETVNAVACDNCGECLPRCPYNLHIPDLLKETHINLRDKPSKRLWG